MTKQQIKEKLYDWFFTKDKPICKDEHGNCVYRNDYGNKCAAGLFIPDELYTPLMEGKTIEDDIFLNIEVIQSNIGLFQCLQRAHDGSYMLMVDKDRKDITFDSYEFVFNNSNATITKESLKKRFDQVFELFENKTEK